MEGIKTPHGFTEVVEYSKVCQTTKWQMISPLEFYVSCKAVDATAKWEELNSCRICMCELWEDLEDTGNDGKLMKDMYELQHELHAFINDEDFLR